LSNYKRTTRICSFEELQPALRRALRDYFIAHELPDVEGQILICCETVSELQKTSFLEKLLGENQDPLYHLAAFLTPEWLFWVRGSATSKTTAVAARLKDIRVRSRASVLLQEPGLDIEGFVEGSFAKLHGYIALGIEPAAEEFCKVVEQAVETANPPRRLLDLFGKAPK
jgi:hypothetical protein